MIFNKKKIEKKKKFLFSIHENNVGAYQGIHSRMIEIIKCF